MIPLPNGCWRSKISVHPENWEKGKHDLSQIWYISYRFYDPAKPRPKQIIIKGMNAFKDLADRRSATRTLIDNELGMLSGGYNPFYKRIISPIEIEYEVDPSTPFIIAYRKALDKLRVTNRVRIGIKSVIKGLEKAAAQLLYLDIPVERITRRHIKVLLEQAGRNSPRWSNNRFNCYRGYLMMLYKELVEMEAVSQNPIRDISKRQVVRRPKKVLTDKQRQDVDLVLKEKFPAFREFVHLFFHSGARMPELLQLKPHMVDLEKQKYRCVIKKRRQHGEEERPIKSIALQHWRYFLDNCPQDHYIFGTLFSPGLKPMGESMPANYWKKIVKIGMGIDVDFYSLKHLNTSEVVDALDESAAATLNAHTSTAMVVNIYDVKQKERQHNRIKSVTNTFAG